MIPSTIHLVDDTGASTSCGITLDRVPETEIVTNATYFIPEAANSCQDCLKRLPSK